MLFLNPMLYFMDKKIFSQCKKNIHLSKQYPKAIKCLNKKKLLL